MKSKLIFSFLVITSLLAIAPTAMASNTWYVDGVNGNDNNDCKTSQTACQTIGHAISLASSGDSIMVAPAIYTENLTISIGLKIIGSGAVTTIVDGRGVDTVFFIKNAKAHVVLSKLTIRNGYQDGGGIFNNGGTLTINDSIITANVADPSHGQGGGILTFYGMVTINHSTISGNSAADGAGILDDYGTVTINNSTISGNSATDGGGILNWGVTLAINHNTISGNSAADGAGILENNGTVTINNSTISGNSATDAGGGIENYTTLTISNSTISGNGASKGGGIDQNNRYGVASTILQNSVVANNTRGNCTGAPAVTSSGYNLSSDGTCKFSGPGDMNDTKPKLGKLGNHGGPTETIPLRLGSPAIDAGNPNGCTDDKGNLLKTDQRGLPRPGKYKQDKPCDIGAYERQKD